MRRCSFSSSVFARFLVDHEHEVHTIWELDVVDIPWWEVGLRCW